MPKRRRSILLAFLLSLPAPGLGLLYAGQGRKAGLIALITAGIFVLAAVTNASDHYQTHIIYIVTMLAVQLYSCLSAARHAANSTSFQARPYNNWGVYLIYFVISASILQYIQAHKAEIFGAISFRIPGDSMAPTLLPNDFILVDINYTAYQPGDIVAFHAPDKPGAIYLKRIAALAGDRLAIRDGKTILNGEVSGVLSMAAQYQHKASSLWLEEITVPAGMVYLLGDKRDQSHDSRKFGAVSQDALIGKATDIWFSFNFQRIGRRIE